MLKNEPKWQACYKCGMTKPIAPDKVDVVGEINGICHLGRKIQLTSSLFYYYLTINYRIIVRNIIQLVDK